MNQVRKFIGWLSFRPSSSEIARALASEYLAPFGASSVRICRINSDDSNEMLGHYGCSDELLGKLIPGKVWRSADTDESRIITGATIDNWAPNAQLYVAPLRDRGVLQGHLIVEFSNPVAEKDQTQIAEDIEDLSVPISLYLSFQYRGSANLTVSPSLDKRDSRPIQLTQRQIVILRGMVEGKTNHDLATEMGFSVSTIRHETMRIYQSLAVSDRKEAAKKALMFSLL